jgi:molybdenum cofactor biosynthesis MoaF-like protein
MASQPTSPLPVGQVLEISFATFTPRITIHSAREPTVEIVAGDGAGFSDTVEYEAVAVRDGLVMLSWQEHTCRSPPAVLPPRRHGRLKLSLPWTSPRYWPGDRAQ